LLDGRGCAMPAAILSHMPRGFLFCPRCGARLTGRDADAGTKSRCSAGCGFVDYDNPVPVVSAVVEHDGRVVLARNKAWPPSWYALVAGFLEANESPDDAVRREVKEELGLEAQATHLIGVYPFPRMNQVIIAYHVMATGPITLNHELVDYRLVEPSQCTAWRAGTGFALRDWLRSRGFEPQMTDLPGDDLPDVGDIQERRS
jgi:NAD+ diphosphatase